jgi:predicted secreted hydrolase
VTDVTQGDHVSAERFARGAAGLAGATGEPYAVWLEDWEAVALEQDGSAVRLAAHDEASGLFLELALRARKPLVAHGDRGLSPKSDEPGNASYYVGYTRLAASGRIGIGERQSEVAGEAWFDHEWSTSALGAGALGWDWFSLQLDDGRELMHFQIRGEDGDVEPVSSGTLVAADGATRRLTREDVVVLPLRHWMSPHTRVRYPVGWRLRVPSEGLELRVEPWLDDQEMRTSFLYWEGAVRVSGTAADEQVSGVGYVELTGYGRSMRGVF